jgi:predicted pyridoxine 5'-phosphate oxidase superfamily flavin-nucleotide-binding protein
VDRGFIIKVGARLARSDLPDRKKSAARRSSCARARRARAPGGASRGTSARALEIVRIADNPVPRRGGGAAPGAARYEIDRSTSARRVRGQEDPARPRQAARARRLCLTPVKAAGYTRPPHAMSTPPRSISSDVAFTPAVKELQRARGSRAAYARMEAAGGWSTEIDADLAAFIAEQTSCFFGTANADGQPYIQHRGGPPGFLRVLDERTIAFADYRGNRQYISTGNLSENPRVHLFLIDYAHRRRIKIWGEARVIDDDDAFAAKLLQPGDGTRVEQAIVIRVEAWDANCPKHIPQLVDARDVAAALAERDAKIEALEAELRRRSQ